MSDLFRSLLYVHVLIVSIALVIWNAIQPSLQPVRIAGTTMGTTYHVTYYDARERDFKKEIDSVLREVNRSINMYDSTSEVSAFNRSEKGIAIRQPHLYPPLKIAYEVYRASDGAFDPTVMPLVNAWGFGPEQPAALSVGNIDSLLAMVGFDKVSVTSSRLVKSHPGTQLDFGGIGQGYGADVVVSFLKSQGVKDMLVEIGGEGMAVGINAARRRPWEIGITDPAATPDSTFFKAYVSVSNRSFTTAGNYFNYRVINGKKYSHTIDPKSGYPSEKAILSASVFSNDCTTADAWDTAFMVMGHEKAIAILHDHPELDALLIYSDASGAIKTYITKGLIKNVHIEP